MTTDYLKMANAGALSRGDAAEVARRLEAGEGDPYDWLLALGRGGAVEHRLLIEKFLESEGDPMLARLALQVLCRYWGLGAEYRDVMVRFIEKVPWDEDDDVRLMAIDCMGEVLSQQPEADVLSVLLSLYEDQGERQIVREAAYCAMARSVGVPVRELPSAAKHFDLEKDVDQGVLEKVGRLILGEVS